MLFSKEYVGYLARQVTQKLIAGEFIETNDVNATTERVNAALDVGGCPNGEPVGDQDHGQPRGEGAAVGPDEWQ